MEIRAVRLLVLFFALALCGVVVLGAGRPPEQATGHLSKDQALALVRTINVAEMDVFNVHHQYGSLGEVLKQHPFEGHHDLPVLTDASSGTFLGYKVSVVAEVGGQHYMVGLVPLKATCNPAVFTNEEAVIYTAAALGCPQEAKNIGK
ncbi:MAG: hypothetical protein WAM69_11635 [Candidatus Sulfotelmatobacter sp.]